MRPAWLFRGANTQAVALRIQVGLVRQYVGADARASVAKGMKSVARRKDACHRFWTWKAGDYKSKKREDN